MYTKRTNKSPKLSLLLNALTCSPKFFDLLILKGVSGALRAYSESERKKEVDETCVRQHLRLNGTATVVEYE